MPRSANKLSGATLPAAPGTYVLLLALAAPTPLHAGRLGAFTLAAGLYAYVGSARGPGGLRARVQRHLRASKAPHWHIDALTACAPVIAVWYKTSPERLECAWAEMLAALPGAQEPVPGFGASDCACRTHLFRLPAAAVPAAWQALAGPSGIGDARLTGPPFAFE